MGTNQISKRARCNDHPIYDKYCYWWYQTPNDSVWVRRHDIGKKKESKEYVQRVTVIDGCNVSTNDNGGQRHSWTDDYSRIIRESSTNIYDLIDESSMQLKSTKRQETTVKKRELPPPPVPPRLKSETPPLLPRCPIMRPIITTAFHMPDSYDRASSLNKNVDEESSDEEYAEAPDDSKAVYQKKASISDADINTSVYEARVRKHWQKIIEKLVVPQVLPYLRSVIDEATEAEVRKKGTKKSHTSAAELLLEKMVSSSNPDKWEIFIQALKASGHLAQADLLNGEDIQEDPDHYSMIRLFAPELRVLIKPCELTLFLISLNVITPEDSEEIRCKEREQGSIAAADLLLDRIHRKHPTWFRNLIVACKRSNHDEVVNVLKHGDPLMRELEDSEEDEEYEEINGDIREEEDGEDGQKDREDWEEKEEPNSSNNLDENLQELSEKEQTCSIPEQGFSKTSLDETTEKYGYTNEEWTNCKLEACSSTIPKQHIKKWDSDTTRDSSNVKTSDITEEYEPFSRQNIKNRRVSSAEEKGECVSHDTDNESEESDEELHNLLKFKIQIRQKLTQVKKKREAVKENTELLVCYRAEQKELEIEKKCLNALIAGDGNNNRYEDTAGTHEIDLLDEEIEMEYKEREMKRKEFDHVHMSLKQTDEDSGIGNGDSYSVFDIGNF